MPLLHRFCDGLKEFLEGFESWLLLFSSSCVITLIPLHCQSLCVYFCQYYICIVAHNHSFKGSLEYDSWTKATYCNLQFHEYFQKHPTQFFEWYSKDISLGSAARWKYTHTERETVFQPLRWFGHFMKAFGMSDRVFQFMERNYTEDKLPSRKSGQFLGLWFHRNADNQTIEFVWQCNELWKRLVVRKSSSVT